MYVLFLVYSYTYFTMVQVYIVVDKQQTIRYRAPSHTISFYRFNTKRYIILWLVYTVYHTELDVIILNIDLTTPCYH